MSVVADRTRSIVVAKNDQVEALPPILAVRTGGESRIRLYIEPTPGGSFRSVARAVFREDVMQK